MRVGQRDTRHEGELERRLLQAAVVEGEHGEVELAFAHRQPLRSRPHELRPWIHLHVEADSRLRHLACKHAHGDVAEVDAVTRKLVRRAQRLGIRRRRQCQREPDQDNAKPAAQPLPLSGKSARELEYRRARLSVNLAAACVERLTPS